MKKTTKIKIFIGALLALIVIVGAVFSISRFLINASEKNANTPVPASNPTWITLKTAPANLGVVEYGDTATKQLIYSINKKQLVTALGSMTSNPPLTQDVSSIVKIVLRVNEDTYGINDLSLLQTIPNSAFNSMDDGNGNIIITHQINTLSPKWRNGTNTVTLSIAYLDKSNNEKRLDGYEFNSSVSFSVPRCENDPLSLEIQNEAIKGDKVPIKLVVDSAKLNACVNQDVLAVLMVVTDKEFNDGLTKDQIPDHRKKIWPLKETDGLNTTYDWDTSGSQENTHYHVVFKIFASTAVDGLHTWLGGKAEGEITLKSKTDTGGSGGTGSGDGSATSGSTYTVPGNNGVGFFNLPIGKVKNWQDLFNLIITLLLYAVFAATLIGVITGGTQMIESAGDAQKMLGGKKKIIYSLGGMLLAIITQMAINRAIDLFSGINFLP